MAALNADQHREYATITVKKKGKKPQGRFPIPPGDKNHARLALSMLGRAKGLSDEDKAKIRAKAERTLHGGGDKSTESRRMDAMKRYRDRKAG